MKNKVTIMVSCEVRDELKKLKKSLGLKNLDKVIRYLGEMAK